MSTIELAKEFGEYPAGRYRSDGNYSGERFRDDFLAPRLVAGEPVAVILDGIMGLGSSFLEEAFGGLVRVHHIKPAQLKKQLSIVSEEEPDLIEEIWEYIEDV